MSVAEIARAAAQLTADQLRERREALRQEDDVLKILLRAAASREAEQRREEVLQSVTLRA